TLAGLAGTVAGAQALVFGARGIAAQLGLEEGFVGLTLVAVGTSLPELFTAVQAARQGKPDLIAGNILGSNIMNGLAVGGTAALLAPGRVQDPHLDGLANAIMVGAAALGWLLMGTRRTVSRWEGVVLVAVFLVTVPLVAG
ncbi:MAG: sodium:calcium antiporter, partial [Actinomycetota bacterium]|nr:sodium:calcium antiporter [Actinomycetota bacterium]